MIVSPASVSAFYVDNYKIKMHGLNEKDCRKIRMTELNQTYGKQNCISIADWRPPIYAEAPGPLGIGKTMIKIENGYCYIGIVCQGERR